MKLSALVPNRVTPFIKAAGAYLEAGERASARRACEQGLLVDAENADLLNLLVRAGGTLPEVPRGVGIKRGRAPRRAPFRQVEHCVEPGRRPRAPRGLRPCALPGSSQDSAHASSHSTAGSRSPPSSRRRHTGKTRSIPATRSRALAIPQRALVPPSNSTLLPPGARLFKRATIWEHGWRARSDKHTRTDGSGS